MEMQATIRMYETTFFGFERVRAHFAKLAKCRPEDVTDDAVVSWCVAVAEREINQYEAIGTIGGER